MAPALCPGDVIRIIAPASPFDRDLFLEAVLWLEKRGYQVRYAKDIFSNSGYLAGSDDRRHAEWVAAFSDPSVRAVFVARGGYGSMRLFDAPLRRQAFAQKKVFMALSDLTPMLNWMAWQKNTISIHGPVMASQGWLGLKESEKDRLFSYLEVPQKRVLKGPKGFQIFRKGSAQGKIFGGNLSMIAATMGTPLELPFAKSILFLEDVKEPKYRLDRLFAQLALAKVFDRISGLVLGEFTDEDGLQVEDQWLGEIVDRFVKKRKIPVLAGLCAGHTKNLVWLPIGGWGAIATRKNEFEVSALVRA